MKALHRFAIVTTALTFVLLLMGGLVHNTRSSLACPDWPLCYGQVLPKMEGRVAVEHSHRLVATTVGLMTIVLLGWLWRSGDRALRRLGALALALVIGQGLLGGLTVIYRLPTLVSTAHLAMSQLFFCTLIFVVLRTRPGVAVAEPLPARVHTLTAWAAGLVYAQMLMGALMRHLGAGLACLDLPLCRGSVWPGDAVPALKLHMLHRLFALVVLGVVLAASVTTARATRGWLRALAVAAPVLVCVQIALGLLSISTFLDVVPVTAHLGVAALILADLVALHLVARGRAIVSAPVAAPAPLAGEVAA